MPWQAHLWIGVPVANDQQARDALAQLGRPDLVDQVDDVVSNVADVFDNAQPPVTIPVRLEHGGLVLDPPCVKFRREAEGGSDWPAPSNESYTDAVIGFQITSHFAPTLLDAGHPHGRSEPFIIDVDACQRFLAQVRKHWPQAQLLMWDM